MSYKGLWFKVSADYLDDPKILAAGVEGECLFIRSLAWAKKQQQPVIPTALLPRLGIGISDTATAVARLCEVNLWTEQSDGYKITAWEAWQVNEKNENQSKGATLAMHNRWHQHRKSPTCVHCQNAAEKQKVQIVEFHPEAERLASVLAELMVANGCKKPTVTDTWIGDMERLNRIDGHTYDDIERVLRWCQNDPFWKSNILSPAKFRKQYDQLKLKSQAKVPGAASTEGLRAWEEVLAAIRRYGSMNAPEWTDPKIEPTLRAVGGYRAVGMTTQLELMKRHFITAYSENQ